MAAIYHAEIPVDLAGASRERPLPVQFFRGDNDSHIFTAWVGDSANPEAGLLAGTVAGTALRGDGVTVPLAGEKGSATVPVTFNGITVQATPCRVTLPQAAFRIPGMIKVSILLTDGGITTTVLSLSGSVVQTNTDAVTDPEELIPNIPALQTAAAQAIAAAEDAETAAASVPALVAPTFNTTTAYAAGDYVYYNGSIWRFTTAHAAGAWTGSDAVAVTVTGEVSDLKSAVEELEAGSLSALGAKNSQIPIANGDGTWSWGGDYADLDDQLARINVYLGSAESIPWSKRMEYIRLGYGADMFPVGTQFTTLHSRFGNLVWDVVDHDLYRSPTNPSGHTMTLATHYCKNQNSQGMTMMNMGRGMFTITGASLPAGSYKFLCKWRWSATNDNSKTFYFTLANAIPDGGQIRFYNANNNTSMTAVAGALASYASPSATTPIEEISPSLTAIENAVDLADVVGGILMPAGMAEVSAFDYSDTDIRQWLNSDAGIGEWYTQKTPFNCLAYPCAYANAANASYLTGLPGFMNELDASFAECVIPVDYLCKAQAWSYSHDPGEIYTVRDKFILPSLKEFGISNYETDYEALQQTFSYYAGVPNAKRIKYDTSYLGSAYTYATRTPSTGVENRNGGVRMISYLGGADRYPPAEFRFVMVCTLG